MAAVGCMPVAIGITVRIAGRSHGMRITIRGMRIPTSQAAVARGYRI
jgi:hypothetical protein